jgi:hypothetical protein
MQTNFTGRRPYEKGEERFLATSDSNGILVG